MWTSILCFFCTTSFTPWHGQFLLGVYWRIYLRLFSHLCITHHFFLWEILSLFYIHFIHHFLFFYVLTNKHLLILSPSYISSLPSLVVNPSPLPSPSLTLPLPLVHHFLSFYHQTIIHIHMLCLQCAHFCSFTSGSSFASCFIHRPSSILPFLTSP